MSPLRWTAITLGVVLGTPYAAAQAENDGAGEAPLRRPVNTPILPVDAGQPDAPATLYPEGTYFSKQSGRLLRARTGDTIFVPDHGPEAPGVPLVLLPSQTLDRLEGALGEEWSRGAGAAGERRVVLSGQTYVFHDKLYMMPTAYSLAPSGAEPAEAEPAPGERAGDARVQDIISELERRRAIPRALDPSEPRTPTAGASLPSTPEGSQILSRRGRIVAMRGGGWLFTPDSGTTNRAEPPMILLPCRQLEVVERLGPGRMGSAAFRVSGRVYTYRGRGYLLPTLVQTMTPGDLIPTQ